MYFAFEAWNYSKTNQNYLLNLLEKIIFTIKENYNNYLVQYFSYLNLEDQICY